MEMMLKRTLSGATCHRYMDAEWRALSTDPAQYRPWLHSEEFLHLIALTLLRRAARGVVKVS